MMQIENVILLSLLPTCSVTGLERVFPCAEIHRRTTLLIRLFSHVPLHLSCAHCSREEDSDCRVGWRGGGILNTCTACTRLSDSQCEKLSVNDVLPKAKHMKYRGQTLPPVGGCEDRIKDLVGSLYINKQSRLHLRDMKSHVR